MRGANLDDVIVYCVVCGTTVPVDRKRRRSFTCSDICAKTRDSYLRSRKEAKACKYCANPSTPEQREDYKLWRRERRAKMLAEVRAAKEKLEAVDAGK